jgi:hypothetical protein
MTLTLNDNQLSHIDKQGGSYGTDPGGAREYPPL